MKNSFVSVVIPSYNSRGGLERSVDSVLSQTYRNFEVIIVDDNNPGTDARRNTEQIMEKYKNDSRVVYLKHDFNKNGAAARNTGIRASKGELVAFLDDDDTWYPTKLEKQIAYLEAHRDCDCVYCFATFKGVRGYSTSYQGNAILELLCLRTKMYTPSLLFTKSSLEIIGGFDESFIRHQDYELLAKFFEKGFKICCLEEYLIDIYGLGGNRLDVDRMIKLKEHFLVTFNDQIKRLECIRPGSEKRIITSNYASVFYSALSLHQFSKAKKIFVEYFKVSPLYFTTHILFLIKQLIYDRFSKVLSRCKVKE